jgi:hypothetical protein
MRAPKNDHQNYQKSALRMTQEKIKEMKNRRTLFSADCRESHFYLPPRKPIGKPSRRQRQGGQIVVEYVLLLAIAVSLALIITKTLIGRTEGSPGIVIQAWEQLIEAIGADKADDIDDKAKK